MFSGLRVSQWIRGPEDPATQPAPGKTLVGHSMVLEKRIFNSGSVLGKSEE
jgi:hypothetical protein